MLSTYGLIFVSTTDYLLLTVIRCAQCERGCLATVGTLCGQLLHRLSHGDHVQHLQHSNAVWESAGVDAGDNSCLLHKQDGR